MKTKPAILGLALLLVPGLSAFGQTTFTRIDTGVIVNDGGNSQGCAWGDYDNDGFLDLFVANFGQNNFLYHNNGNGTFIKITAGAIVTDSGNSLGASWGDYDNDGFLDLFVANSGNQGNFLYRNNGDGSFTTITAGAIVNDGGSSSGASWGDYDNDGFLDLFVANSGQNNFLYRNNGDGSFTKITAGAIVTDGGLSHSASWGDYDNDGFLDLFVANSNQNNFLYRNNGNGTFTKITTGAIVNDGGNSQDCAWGDYDNDGFLDLFVANFDENSFLYRNNGNGSFTKITIGEIVNDGGNSLGASWGDYDNDGFLDLFVANSFGQNNFLYRNNGNGSFAKITTGAIVNNGGDSNGASWGDFDNDGFLDLFVANFGQNNFLYRNNGNGNNWINLRLVGTVSNHSGIGAKVRVKATINGTPAWQEQELSGQTGNSLNAEFGFGDAAIVDSIRVQWSNGIIQDTTNVAVKQFLSITERPFTRITTGAIVSDGGSSGASWGDYDNDGFLDLVAGNILYHNNGNGSFTKITTGANGASWGDYDNDGFLDLAAGNRIYHNNGDGTFGAIVNDGGFSHSASWGDYDNDGFLDLFVANYPNNFLYRNNGNGSFTKITTGAIVNDGGSSSGASWADYDNDGFLDLFVANANNQNNFLYRNNGNGSFTKITTGDIVNDGGNSIGASWVDYDNDSFLDLFVANFGQNSFLYRNNGNGSFTKITTGDIVNDGENFRGASWGDFDNDGFLDLFVANFFINNFLYRNNGNGSFTKITTGDIVTNGTTSLTRVTSWGDYDNDGFLDLFVANSRDLFDFDEFNFLYRNNGKGNNWINLRLVGTVSNHSGIGAKVRVKATINGAPVWQMQELSGQTGYRSQNSLNAEFGLRKATVIDTIQIKWPSRAVNVYPQVKVNQFLTVRENNRPRVAQAISNITLSSARSDSVRDLNAPTVFADPDGDTLTYTARSQNPSAVTASVSGSILTVSLVSDTAKSPGHTKITVTADDGRVDDGRGNTEEMTFAVNRSPYVLEKITDIKFLESGKFVKDLKKVFKDPDGDNVTYSPSSSDTSVALAAFSESKLVVVPFALGNAMITVIADDGSGGKTTIQFGVAVITSPAPEIRHAPIATAKLEEEIPITAEITDDENAIALAVLQYRAAGALGFIPLSMDTLQGKFHSTIPVSAVTDRGVEYYIAAKDIHNVPARLPAATGVFSVRVRVDDGITNKRPQPSGGEQKSYHLFSIPLDADKKKPSEVLVLENNLGPYNIKKWRFYDIATDTATGVVSNIQFPNTGEMAPGKAFWLIVKDSDRFINTGPGTTVLTSEPFAIALKKGWNFVGNPFNFPAFAEDSLSNRRLLKFYAYEAGQWSDPIKPADREFQPFESYAVYCSTACRMFINPNRFSSFGKALAKTETSSDEDVFWSIRILAQCQEARDGNNLAAILQAASRDLDRIDQPEPPVIGEYVSVYFPHREWNTLAKTYCLDARPEPVEGEVWKFEVKTNIRDQVNLTFEGIDSVPKEFEVWLVDDALQITQNLREQWQYAVAGAGADHPKQLKLVVGRRGFVDEKLASARAIPTTYELSQNFPNPFNPATTIRYGLPKAERVTLKIYNLLGAEVALIINDELRAAGYHAAIWDGRDKNGKVVASGVYVYRLQAGSFVMTKKLALIK